MLDAKLGVETSILHVNNSFTGPLIIGIFKKRSPEGHVLAIYLFSC